MGVLAPKFTMSDRPNKSEPVYGVTCMHGQEECAGNVQELCAAKYHPTSEWWPFVQCQNFQGRDNIGTPKTALRCAKAAGIDWEHGKAGQCAGEDGRGSEGIQLLQQSVKDSIAVGIRYVLSMREKPRLKPVIEKAVQLSLMANKCAYGMALGTTVRYVVKDIFHNGQGLTMCAQGGHTPADFIGQINEEYDKLNSVD